MSAFPFRMRVRTASADKIDAANRAGRRCGTSALPSVEDALAECVGIKVRRTRRALRALVQYPDERVPVALASSKARGGLSKTVREWLAWALSARAVADAEAEGVLWTPLLDTIRQATVWYADSDRNGLSFVGPDDVLPPPSQETLADRHRKWASTTTDPDQLYGLVVGFRDDTIARDVAQSARVFSPALIAALLGRSQDITLARNPALPDTVRANIRTKALDTLLTPPANNSASIRARLLLAKMSRGGHPLTRAERSLLLAPGVKQTWQTIELLCSSDLELDEEPLLLERVRELPDNSRYVMSLMRRKTASVELWREALGVTRSPLLRKHLLRQPRALKDPEIIAILQCSESLEVILGLLDWVPDEDYPRQFAQLVRRDPWAALTHLEGGKGRMALLDPTALLPLLESGESRVRLRAIEILSTLRSQSATKQASRATSTRSTRGL